MNQKNRTNLKETDRQNDISESAFFRSISFRITYEVEGTSKEVQNLIAVKQLHHKRGHQNKNSFSSAIYNC